MDKAPDAVIIYNPDNSFSYINPAATDLLGYQKSEIIGMKVTDFLHPTERTRLEVVKIQRRQGDSSPIEWKAVRRDGVVIDIEVSTRYLDETQQWISFIRDISIRKKMEEQIQRAVLKEQVLKAKAKLLQDQRRNLLALSKAKDDFIMMASHQLRTPATSVKQYVGMILNGYFGTLTDEQHRILKTAYDANERQMRIVNNLLLTAEFESGQARALGYVQDLVGCIKELLNEMMPALALKHQTVVIKMPRSCKVFCDANLLKTALGHIIDNASRYSPAGKSILVQLVRRNRCAVITVADQGVGIRWQDRKLLFRKFTRIPNSLTDTINGNGLGLYLTKQIIKLHNGDITINSRASKGSVFTLRVPLNA